MRLGVEGVLSAGEASREITSLSGSFWVGWGADLDADADTDADVVEAVLVGDGLGPLEGEYS